MGVCTMIATVTVVQIKMITMVEGKVVVVLALVVVINVVVVIVQIVITVVVILVRESVRAALVINIKLQ